MFYQIFSNDDGGSITVVHEGKAYVAASTSPNFALLCQKAIADDVSVIEDFDTAKVVGERFESLTDRVVLSNGHLYLDGDLVDNSLTRQVLRFMDDGVENFMPLVRFFENCASNPNEHSREQLFTWLLDRDFAITDDGCFIAYKGVLRVNPDDVTQGYQSVSLGTAWVNGEKHTGRIPNFRGAVVTMPRSNVAHAPEVGCSTGLHAGTWEYASNFGNGGTLTVKINPRDVVSVPTDCAAQKLRTCRYTVLEAVEQPLKESFYAEDEDYFYDDGLCEDCQVFEGDECTCGSGVCPYCYDSGRTCAHCGA